MASFFEKLKKGMGVNNMPAEEPEENNEVKAGEKEEADETQKKQKVKNSSEKSSEVKIERQEKTGKPALEREKKEKWPSFNKEAEGQLAIDVYQTESELVVQSAIAGVKPESLDISIEGDMVTIKGTREKPQESGEKNYFYQECFWGPFSRQIVLSVETDPSRTDASLKDGILTIRMPKIERERKRKITVKG